MIRLPKKINTIIFQATKSLEINFQANLYMLRLWGGSSLHVTNSSQPSSILNLSRVISLLFEVQFVFYLKENASKREESPSTRRCIAIQ